MSWKDDWRPAGGWTTYVVVLGLSMLVGGAVTYGIYQAAQPPKTRLVITPTPSASTHYVIEPPATSHIARAPPVTATGQASIPGVPYTPYLTPSPEPDPKPTLTPTPTPTLTPSATATQTGSTPPVTPPGSPTPGVVTSPPPPSQSGPGGF